MGLLAEPRRTQTECSPPEKPRSAKRDGESEREHRLVDHQLEVCAAGFVVLVMFYVADPKFAPHLNQRSSAHIKLDENQRCQVTLRVVVRKVGERVAEVWVVRRAQDAVRVSRVLHSAEVVNIEMTKVKRKTWKNIFKRL